MWRFNVAYIWLIAAMIAVYFEGYKIAFLLAIGGLLISVIALQRFIRTLIFENVEYALFKLFIDDMEAAEETATTQKEPAP